MATYTVDQWITKMDSRLKEIKDDKVFVLEILGLIAKYTKRIFEDGLKSSGDYIGEYSHKPMLATKDQFPVKSKFKISTIESTKIVAKKGGGFRSAGKTKRQLWIKFKKAKKAVPIMLIEGGYKEFKGIIGRGTRVNLRLFDELMKDAQAQRLRKTEGGFDYVLKKDINMKKRQWLETKYGKIFNLTDKERIDFINELTKIVKSKLSN